MDRSPRGLVAAAGVLLAAAASVAHADVEPVEAAAGSGSASASDAGSGSGSDVAAPPPPVPVPVQPPVLLPDPSSFRSVTSIDSGAALAIFLGGGAVGFVAHESGHVVVNHALGNSPQFQHITTFGFIPFLAINPRLNCHGSVCLEASGKPLPGGEAGKYAIVTAGFDVQHITTEVLLTLEPDLRYRDAPFRKGLFTFDILLSVGYALASVTGVESPFGDAGNAADASGLPRVVFSAVLLAPAALDTYRYFRPKSKWAPWVSRAAKVGMVGITFGI